MADTDRPGEHPPIVVFRHGENDWHVEIEDDGTVLDRQPTLEQARTVARDFAARRNAPLIVHEAGGGPAAGASAT